MALAESITAKVVALAVIVLVICTAAIPTISDAQDQIKSTTNNTNTSYRVIDASMSDVYSYEVIDDKLYCNGEEIVGFNLPSAGRMYGVFASDRNLGQLMSTGQINLDAVLPNAGAPTSVLQGTGKVIYNAGTLQVYKADTEITSDVVDYTWAIVPYFTEDSSYGRVVVSSGTEKYISNDSEMYIILPASAVNSSWTSGGTAKIIASGNGTVKSIIVTYNDSGTIATSTDITGISISGLTKVDDLHYSFVNLTVTTPAGTTTVNTDVYIPLEYEYISNDDDSMRSLFGIIPILLVMIPVMFAVRMIGARN